MSYFPAPKPSKSDIDRLENENARLCAELERVNAAAAEMREALGMAGPWPVIDVLRELANWCQHCGLFHNCDCDGHELRSAAVRESRVMADRISKSLSTDAGQGYVRKEDVKALVEALSKLPDTPDLRTLPGVIDIMEAPKQNSAYEIGIWRGLVIAENEANRIAKEKGFA